MRIQVVHALQKRVTRNGNLKRIYVNFVKQAEIQ